MTQANEQWLSVEIERLANLIDAPKVYVVSFDPHIDMGAPYIQVGPGEELHWIVKERGATFEDRVTRDPDELLFWSFRATTFSMAADWEVRHRMPGQDSRIGLFAKQEELLSRLSKGWVGRWRADLLRRVPDAVNLLPAPDGPTSRVIPGDS